MEQIDEYWCKGLPLVVAVGFGALSFVGLAATLINL